MTISIVSLFPQIYDQFLTTSLVQRARKQAGVDISTWDLFSFCAQKERVDGHTFGPGSGMVIRPEVVERAVNEREAAAGPAYKVFFSPHGQTLTQPLLEQMYQEIQAYAHAALFPARYEGMDSRIEHVYADRVISIGNYVLMGGDVPAMVLLEGLLRYVPGVVGKAESVQYESFMGPFVDYPAYTRPITWQGITVPDVLRSGNHREIQKWRMEQAVERTVHQHFTWLSSHQLTDIQKTAARRHIPSHYLVLMHTDVVLPNDTVGETSVTSIDVHDIARSARTYGVERVYIVTPLADQQKIVNRLLTYWQEAGSSENVNRHDALARVELAESLESVICKIQETYANPCLIGTTAQAGDEPYITYYDQDVIWQQYDAVVAILGTARGLSNAVRTRCTYMFDPIEGMTTFNHLSVRSAAAVMLDRWLGVRVKYKRKPYGNEYTQSE